MRVVAGLAAVFLVTGLSAVAQFSPPRTTTAPDSAAVFCTQESQPTDGRHPEGSSLSRCVTRVIQGCPVDMRVHQRRGGATVAVDDKGIQRRFFSQRLRLILNSFRIDDARHKAISATVTVHGTGMKARIQSLAWAPDSPSMARTFNVDLAQLDDPGVSGDFLIPGFTSASRVDLESITYDDGSTWKLSKNESCRVAPDPLMLIDK